MAITVLESNLDPDEVLDTTGWVNEPVPLKSLKKGEFFTLKDVPEPKESQVWIKDTYEPSERAFWCKKWDDISGGKFFKGDKKVYTNFIF